MLYIGVKNTASRFLWHLIQAYREQTWSDVAALGSQGELRFACYLYLPLFSEGRAPRLAILDHLSLSKPFIPNYSQIITHF